MSRVSMLIMGHPQFNTQNDSGIGDGIPPIPEWQLNPAVTNELPELTVIDVDNEVSNVFIRLRNVFQQTQNTQLLTTQLHDLTSFVIHRLLHKDSDKAAPASPPISECIRYAIILYMFVIQGPTYYSHAIILNTIVTHLRENLKCLDTAPRVYNSLDVWLLTIGMVASTGTGHYQWFMEKACDVSTALQLSDCEDALTRTKSILWLETTQTEILCRHHWEAIIGTGMRTLPSEFTCISSDSPGPGIL